MSVFYKTNGTIVPKLLPAICDKLSITVDIEPQLRKKIADWTKAELYPTAKRHKYKVAGCLPANEFLAPPHWDSTGESSVLIQCQPRIGLDHMRFLRVEMNPSRIDLPLALHLLDDCLPNFYSHIMKNGVVTQFHLAVDVAHVDIDSCLFFAPNFSVDSWNQKSGKTTYIGAGNYRIYDKLAQIISKNKKTVNPLKQAVPNHPLVRIEKQLNLPSKISLAKVPALPNELKRLCVAAFPHMNGSDETWRLFLRLATVGGAQWALAAIKNKKLKSEYRKRLKYGWMDWWKPEDIWKQLPNIVRPILHPLDHAAAA